MIVPLRLARRSLKRSPQGLPECWAGELRQRIGAVELDMEYAEQRLLFELAQALPAVARAQEPRAAVQASVARYLDLLGVVVTADVQGHVDTVIGACWPAGNGSTPAMVLLRPPRVRC